MSDASTSRRLPLVALGLAGVAVILTVVAVIVVVTRDDATPVAAKSDAPRLIDHPAQATDLVQLAKHVEVVTENGSPKGMRVTDENVRTALGLTAEDMIVAISGRATWRAADIENVLLRASRQEVTTFFAEVQRGPQQVVLRWRVEGNLRDARYAAVRAGMGSNNPFTTPPLLQPPMPGAPDPTAPTAPDPDPLLDTIVKIDDTHYSVPRKTVDELLANPVSFMKAARIVPAMKNGKPEGFKLYAIRPSSPVARIGLQNGDTIHSINGIEIEGTDDGLEVYNQLKTTKHVRLQITRRGKPVELDIDITK